MAEQPLAILVTGSRRFGNRRQLYAVLDKHLESYHRPEILVIHGGATGADTKAGDWAKANKVLCLKMPAHWDVYGRAAGTKRNLKMLDFLKFLRKRGHPCVVEAFPLPGSRGTHHMIRVAQEANFKVNIHEEPNRHQSLASPMWAY